LLSIIKAIIGMKQSGDRKAIRFSFIRVSGSEIVLILPLLLIFSLPVSQAATGTLNPAGFSEPDTLQLSLQEAEKLFLDRNLQLLAEYLDVEMHQAQVRQARLWQNPEFTVEHQMINRDHSGPIGFRSSDNTAFEIEQVLSTAGKRSRTIRLRELEREQAEHRFDRVLRELKGSLREHFFDLAYLNRKEVLYRRQISSLERVLGSFEELQSRGDIARVETLRLHGLLVELEKEFLEVRDERRELERALGLLLHLEHGIPRPQLPDDLEPYLHSAEPFDSRQLLQTALMKRHDLRELNAASSAARQNMRKERSSAWPDVGIGLVYDRLDGVVENYWGVSLNVQVPLFNRNQGAIQAARHRIRQADYQLSHHQYAITGEITRAVNRFEDTLTLYERIDPDYEEDFSLLIETLLHQYREGDIRLVEFIDYYNSFRESMIHIWSVRRDLLNAAEQLNQVTGQDIISFNF